MNTVVTETHLDFPIFTRGKVRDVYDLGQELLLVASDRISAFDYVLPTPIPDKGRVLTGLSVFWFKRFSNLVLHHLILADIDEFPPSLKVHRNVLEGRSMLVKKTQKIPIECVVRGYLSGSGWKEYQKTCSVCGVKLPGGLRESEQLPKPIFTPATKEEGGKHDQNISFEEMAERIGEELSKKLRDLSLKIYLEAATYASSRGLILADTKFEFGLLKGEILLIDELLTPDSSRFWEKAKYQVGRAQDSFDKQYVRDYLESVGWNKQPPVPELPQVVVQKTREKYLEAYRFLVGREFGHY